ncbi:MAG: cytochrome b561 domain-containing protein [Pseudomonadota bacterium]
MDWLLAPIDPARAHEVGLAVSWHGRLMVLAWAVLAPIAVIMARFFKVMPRQDWPRQLDNPTWWRSHWMGQGAVFALSVLGLALVWQSSRPMLWHAVLGYAVFVGLALQILMGIFRGSKGGPTAPSLRGDHYDMTRWRLRFEAVHKSFGYTLLVLAMITVLMGMWLANAPRWMWLGLGFWWLGLIVLSGWLQNRGFAIDTYQAIWGPDPVHPGNRRPPGWGMRRPLEEKPCTELSRAPGSRSSTRNSKPV